MTDPADSFATPRIAAGALFRNAHGQVLMVQPTYKDTWDLPGGYVERGESPAAACRREVLEEIGLDRSDLALIAVDWAPSDTEGDKILFIFDGGEIEHLVDDIVIQRDELQTWRWISIDDLDAYVIPRLSRRIRATATSSAPTAIYLEHGSDPGRTA